MKQIFLNTEVSNSDKIVWTAKTLKEAREYLWLNGDVMGIDVDDSEGIEGFAKCMTPDDFDEWECVCIVYKEETKRPVKAFKTIEGARKDAEFRKKTTKDGYNIVWGLII